jgi:hypothetical protein
MFRSGVTAIGSPNQAPIGSTDLAVSRAYPGAWTSALSAALQTASVTGIVDGDTVSASIGRRASFLLGAGTQVTFAFDGRVIMDGADPYDSAHEGYANIVEYFQDDSD